MAEKFCARWFRKNPNPALLLLVGAPNCGKTHVAKAIYRFASAAAFKALESKHGWDRVPSCRFIRWPEAVDELYDDKYGAVEDAFECDLVVLDDIGAEDDKFRKGANKLCQILSRRERKFTVLTTNISAESWQDKWDLRVADRLTRNAEIIDLTGVDSYEQHRA